MQYYMGFDVNCIHRLFVALVLLTSSVSVESRFFVCLQWLSLKSLECATVGADQIATAFRFRKGRNVVAVVQKKKKEHEVGHN
jgi:hypothetical protein